MKIQSFIVLLLLLAIVGLAKSCNKNKFYLHDEAKNKYGPNKCSNDCDCDRNRRCSPQNFCHECLYLAKSFWFMPKYSAVKC